MGLTLRLLDTLVQVGVVAAWVLGSTWVTWLVYRRRLVTRAGKNLTPEQRADLRRAARKVGLFHRTTVPKDPYDLTTAVVVQPSGDGRPGWGLLAPGPARAPGATAPHGGRMDTTIPIEAGTWLLVYCSGPVGAVEGDIEVLPAERRVLAAREAVQEPARLLGPVDRVTTALGVGWRTTVVYPSGKAVTDTHVDHEGWAYIVGVLSARHHARAVDVLDRILATWKWLSAAPSSAAPDGPS